MPNINSDRRGTIIRQGNVWRIDNALVEEVSVGDGYQSRCLVISYAVRGRPHDTTHIALLRLNVGSDTVITDQFGRLVPLRQIRPEMWIDAEFSPVTTHGNPPQTNAFRIVVRQGGGKPPIPAGSTTRGRIVSIDFQNSFLTTGVQNDIQNQIKFIVTNETVILSRNGRRISLRSLRPGQWVKVTHAAFMTMSIPPQTTAYRIQVL